MIKILTLLFAIGVSLLSYAQPPEGPAKKGMVFGQKTEAVGAVTVDEMVAKVSEEATPVKVKGKVTDVCTKEGCWLKLQTASGKMMVKMKDHSFLVPIDINGKEVVVDGIAKMKITSVRELQHYAEDAGKTKEEIAAIKEPKKEVVLNANGILVL
jgi:hypothetical protein